MPTAEIFPKALKGGASEKLSARKPMIVVKLVIETARKLTRILSLMAAILSSPTRIRCTIVISI